MNNCNRSSVRQRFNNLLSQQPHNAVTCISTHRLAALADVIRLAANDKVLADYVETTLITWIERNGNGQPLEKRQVYGEAKVPDRLSSAYPS